MTRNTLVFCCVFLGLTAHLDENVIGRSVSHALAAETLRVGAVFSSAQTGSQSFLRFHNTGTIPGTVTVNLRDYATGQFIAKWTSPAFQAGSQQQYAINVIENVASPTITVKPSYYTISLEPSAGLSGYFQHVLYRPADGTLTNLSTCDAGTTSGSSQISAVHSSLLTSNFPSSVAINNTSAASATVTLGIYDARNGVNLGTYPAGIVSAGGQVIVPVAAMEAAASITPNALQYHYVIKAEGAFTGFLQHLVDNKQVGVITDMTTVCAISGLAAAIPSPPARVGAIYASTQASSQSFLRFHNTGTSASTATVTLKNYTSGQTLATWTSPSIPAGSQQQYFIGTIESGASQSFTKPAYYAISIDTPFTGYFQHVLWRPADGTLTNLSTCHAGVTANPARLSAVHSSLLASNYPSSVAVHNTGTTATTVRLAIHDATTGVKLGKYTTVSIPPNGQVIVPVTALEAGAGVTPTSVQYHYVVRAESVFTGFLQHLVDNKQASVITDMTTVCALGAQPQTLTANFYVSPSGNDSWSGTLADPNSTNTNGPFATFARAVTAVRTMNKTGLSQVTVQFRGGTYFLPASVTLIPADSGSASTKIVYQNYPGELPVISGGVRIQNWTNVGSNTWRTTLPASTTYFESLFYNGARKLRPRLGGYLGTYYRIGETVYLSGAAPPATAPDVNCPTYVTGKGWECFDRFRYKAGDPIASTWQNLAPSAGNPCNQAAGNAALTGDIELLLFEKYSAAKLRIKCIDTASRTIYLTGATGIPNYESGVSGFIPEHRYLVENVQDQLTQPGQWFLDRSTGPWTLTYITTNSTEDPNADRVIVPQLTHVLRASGVQHVTFQGLAFEHDNFTIPAAGVPGNEVARHYTPAVSIQNSSNITFDGVTVARTTGMGLDFISCISSAAGNASWCATGSASPVSADNVVQNSAFYDLGTAAIGIGFQQRLADSDTNVPQRVTVQNNVIAGYGRVFPNAFGIHQATAHDILYTHNDIYDGYRSAIHICPCNQNFKGPESSGAFNNVISFNHVHNLMQGIMNDAGAIGILSGGTDYASPGNRIINNKIHDINDASAMDAEGYGGDGIYIDDVTGAIDVQNNLVYRVSRAALNITQNVYAPNLPTTIKNNIFAFARTAMILNSRPYPNGTSPAQPIQVFSAANNIFYFSRKDTSSPAFYVQGGCTYSGGHPFSSFQNRSSNLYWRTDGGFATDTKAFRHQPIAGPAGINTLCNAFNLNTHTFLTFSGWQAFGQDVGSLVQNPGFANPNYPADDFSLPNGSPGAGFVVFDSNQAGRTNPVINPPPIPATFPTKAFNPVADF